MDSKYSIPRSASILHAANIPINIWLSGFNLAFKLSRSMESATNYIINFHQSCKMCGKLTYLIDVCVKACGSTNCIVSECLY